MLLVVVEMSCESARACSNSNWVNLIGGEEVNVLKTYVALDDKDNLFVAAQYTGNADKTDYTVFYLFGMSECNFWWQF